MFQQFAHTPKPFPFQKEKPHGFLALDSGVVNKQNAPLCLLAVDLNLEYQTHQYCNSEEGRQRPPKIQKKKSDCKKSWNVYHPSQP